MCVGKGEALITPFLDKLSDFESDASLWRVASSATVFESQSALPICVNISCADAIDITVNAFRAAAEREISIGDGIEICIIRKLDEQCVNCDDTHWIIETSPTASLATGHPIRRQYRSLMSPKLFSIERKYFSLPRH